MLKLQHYKNFGAQYTTKITRYLSINLCIQRPLNHSLTGLSILLA